MFLAEDRQGRSTVILGSANFTRRNLEDLNLETDIAIRGPKTTPIFQDVRKYVDLLWSNIDGREFSVDYIEYADNSFLRRLQYRWMEATGMSTF
jgi:phosphatidylserine/phosphatidylglycerophosphate/cardiolipin synthase-like enzyme